MMLQSRSLWLWGAGLLPVAGLCVLVARAEVAVRSGPTFRIPIRGYDPRDMLHGQYLQYQFDFDWAGNDDCQFSSVSDAQFTPGEERTLQGGCCLCLTRTSPDGFEPSVRHVDCENSELACDGRIRVNDVTPPLRYFVPEERATQLEEALRDADTARPAIEFTLPQGGAPAIKELYLGSEPWRERLGK
jgi:uncharacterized membrane-anchored protein